MIAPLVITLYVIAHLAQSNSNGNYIWVGAISGIIVAFVTVGGALLTSRDSRRASREQNAVLSRLETRKMDLEEFREIQERNEAALHRAEQASARCNEQYEELQALHAEERVAREAANARAMRAEERATDAERKAIRATARLSTRVKMLEDLLVDNGVTIPEAHQ